MIAGIFPTVTSRPFTIPSPGHDAHRDQRDDDSGTPWWSASVFEEMYAVRPTIEPTLRSMLRVSTTIVWPTASTATSATSVAMSCQLPTVMKLFARAQKKTTATPSTMKMPASRRRNAAWARFASRRCVVRSSTSSPPRPGRSTPGRLRATARRQAGPRGSRARGRPSRGSRAARTG